MKKDNLILGILSVFLGIVLMIQLKSTDAFMDGMTSSKKASELKSELSSLKQRKEMLLTELDKLDKIHDDYKISRSENTKKAQEEIKKYEILSGKTDVIGPGLIISISNPKEYEDEELLYPNLEILLGIINNLNKYRVEAISINNQRILNNTAILIEKGNLIVDNKPLYLPFEIKCIGHPEILEKGLNIKYGLIYEAKKDKIINVNMEQKQNIMIPKTTQNIKFKYSKIFKED